MSKTTEHYEEVRNDLDLEFQQMASMPTDSLFKALARFQNEVPIIHKNTTGYGYKYADLPTIIPIINPLLFKNGLGYAQPLIGSSIKTIIFHFETGETLESCIDIPQGVVLKGMNDFQILGSAISYLRRYSLASILGLVTDVDLDASGTQTKKETGLKTISEADFLKLCGAINAGKEHNGEIIDEAWAVKTYTLTVEQLKTIQMLQS